MARILTGVVMVAALVGLTACKRPPEAVTRIQYSFWGSIEQQKVERAIVAAFEEAHPSIKVDLLPIGARYNEKLQAMMVGAVGPDVIMVEMTQYFDWAARGVLLDVTDDLQEMEQEATLMPIPRRAFVYDGRCYALPINCHGVAMYCNLDALRKAGIAFPAQGLTWPELEALAPRLSRHSGTADAPTDFAVLMPYPLLLFWEFGVELFDNAFHPTRVTVNTPAAVTVIDLMRRVNASGVAVPPDMAGDQGTYQLFRDGKVAFYFDGRWRTPDFAGRTDFAWDVAPVPAGPVKRITQHGGTGLAVWKKSRHPAAAREFMRFYASPRGARLSMLAGRYVPVFRELAFGREFLSLRPPEAIVRFSETMEAGASATQLYAPGGQEVAIIFGGRMQQVLSEPNLPATRILAGLEADLKRWLAKTTRGAAL